MRAEIISIGDEMTSGQRLDTNSQWLSQKLSDLGVQTLFHTTVGDDLASNVDVFRIAAKRANIVICSGGLGPTADDLTRDALSQAFDRPLELRHDALEHIESLFAARKRAMPERNRVQAMFPMASKVVPNPHGTAPGIDLAVNTFRPDGSIQSCRFFALPGVPAEMKQMWTETVQKRLQSELGIGREQWFYHEMKVFGIGESDCEALLPDLIKRDRIPRVGITVHQATITLRIAVLAKDEFEANVIAEPTKREIHKALGDLVFGTDHVELHHVIHDKLVAAGQSLGVIEFGDAAVVVPWLASLSDLASTRYGMTASEWYRCDPGVGLNGVASTEEQDQRRLQTAIDFRNQFETDWCLVIGPYPSPHAISSMTGLPTFRFSITIVDPRGSVSSTTVEMGGHPDIILARLGKTGLDHLLKKVRAFTKT
jgi:nicotinamide-nucleotide amidase